MYKQLFGGLSVLLLYSAVSAKGLQGTFDGFDMKTCGAKKCLEIKAEKVSTGMLDGGFASNNAELILTSKSAGPHKIILFSHDLFFDFTDSKVLIRDLKDQVNTEAIYDLHSEDLSFFKVSKVTGNSIDVPRNRSSHAAVN